MATHTAQIPCSITQQLHNQTSHLDQSALREAVTNYLRNTNAQTPLTREVLIQLRDNKIYPVRNRQITFNVLKPVREEIKTRADQDGVTMSAILRRAAYEYTKTDNPDLTAMYDAWGDTAKT